MLYSTPHLDAALEQDLTAFDRLADELGARARGAGPWLGSLRRQWRASSAESSIEIEGYSVPAHERVAIASGAEPADPNDEDRMALSCYARAMDHVGVMAADEGFEWVERAVLDLHFDACYFQKDKDPGQYRKSGIEVTDPKGGPAYVGPPGENVRPLMAEVIRWCRSEDLGGHVIVRAAMAHLHVVSVHPFRDGNGRISRIVQSLVLALGGLLAPEFVSIEEYLGEHTDPYYSALSEVQEGAYQPQRDATPFVRLCVVAHLAQARRRLLQIEQAAARWSFLERLVEERRWPDRLTIALEQSLFDGTDRASYSAEADVSAATASNDLRRLLDAGLITQLGRGPRTRYVGSERLSDDVGRQLAGNGPTREG
ncbi:MAG TPA: Fic family protein [Solirubrobacteraceae bacterium]|jgi:Fic family protein|nr:Fic family protein [Solirubrobacteraceae bacterium]